MYGNAPRRTAVSRYSRPARSTSTRASRSGARASAATVARRSTPNAGATYNSLPRGPRAHSAPPEIKTCDVVVGGAATGVVPFVIAGSAPTPILLNGLQLGSQFYNRIGNKINMKSLRIRGHIQPYATSYSDFLRVVIVYDRQTSGGVAPTYSSLFANMNQTGNGLAGTFDYPSVAWMDRFTVLRDTIVTVPAFTYTAGQIINGGIHTNETSLWIDEYIPLKDLPVAFKSTSSPVTAADINVGAIFMYCVSMVNDNCMRANFMVRLRYYDQ